MILTTSPFSNVYSTRPHNTRVGFLLTFYVHFLTSIIHAKPSKEFFSRISLLALVDLGLIVHVNGLGRLKFEEISNGHIFIYIKKRNTHEKSPDSNAQGTGITFPLRSLEWVISNTLKIDATAMNR